MVHIVKRGKECTKYNERSNVYPYNYEENFLKGAG